MGLTSDRSGSPLCRLQYAAGRIETCPKEACPLWEPGGAVLRGRCTIERLDLAAHPELVSQLLVLRSDLDAAKTGRELEDVRRLFYRLVDQHTGE